LTCSNRSGRIERPVISADELASAEKRFSEEDRESIVAQAINSDNITQIFHVPRAAATLTPLA
jgi:hypothetical protein